MHESYTHVCGVGTVGKISDYQPEGPGFNPQPGRGLNFEATFFCHTETWPTLDLKIILNRKSLFDTLKAIS